MKAWLKILGTVDQRKEYILRAQSARDFFSPIFSNFRSTKDLLILRIPLALFIFSSNKLGHRPACHHVTSTEQLPNRNLKGLTATVPVWLTKQSQIRQPLSNIQGWNEFLIIFLSLTKIKLRECTFHSVSYSTLKRIKVYKYSTRQCALSIVQCKQTWIEYVLVNKPKLKTKIEKYVTISARVFNKVTIYGLNESNL